MARETLFLDGLRGAQTVHSIRNWTTVGTSLHRRLRGQPSSYIIPLITPAGPLWRRKPNSVGFSFWTRGLRHVSKQQTRWASVETHALIRRVFRFVRGTGGTQNAALVTAIGLRIGDGAGTFGAGQWERLRTVRIWGRGLGLLRRGDGGVRWRGGVLGRQFADSERIATDLGTDVRGVAYGA